MKQLSLLTKLKMNKSLGKRSYVDEYDALSPALTVLNAGAALAVNGGALRGQTLADALLNMVSNGEFTTDTTGWSAQASSSISRESAVALGVSPTGGADNYILQVINLVTNGYARFIPTITANLSYRFSANVRVPSANTGVNSALLRFSSGGATYDLSITAEDAWQAKSRTDFVAAASTPSIALFCLSSTSTDRAWFDAVSLRPQAAIVNDARASGLVNAMFDDTLVCPATSGTPFSRWLRNDGTDRNGIAVRTTPNTAGLDTEIFEYVAGVATSRGTADADWATGDVLRCDLRGSVLTVYKQPAAGGAFTQLVQWAAATTPGANNGFIFFDAAQNRVSKTEVHAL